MELSEYIERKLRSANFVVDGVAVKTDGTYRLDMRDPSTLAAAMAFVGSLDLSPSAITAEESSAIKTAAKADLSSPRNAVLRAAFRVLWSALADTRAKLVPPQSTPSFNVFLNQVLSQADNE